MDISCIILAGGKGSRLGLPKTQVIVGRKTLWQRALCNTAFINGDIIVVTSGKEELPPLTGYPAYRLVTDIYPGKGPLVGIFTGLRESRTSYNLVVACDMPFLNQGLLAYMLRTAGDYDAVIPRFGGNVEPLHAVYSRSCLEPIEKMLGTENTSVHRLLELVRARYIEADEIDNFDPEHLSFFNVNTEADLKKARELAKRDNPADDTENQCIGNS